MEIPWETMEEKLTLEEDVEHSWQSRLVFGARIWFFVICVKGKGSSTGRQEKLFSNTDSQTWWNVYPSALVAPFLVHILFIRLLIYNMLHSIQYTYSIHIRSYICVHLHIIQINHHTYNIKSIWYQVSFCNFLKKNRKRLIHLIRQQAKIEATQQSHAELIQVALLSDGDDWNPKTWKGGLFGGEDSTDKTWWQENGLSNCFGTWGTFNAKRTNYSTKCTHPPERYVFQGWSSVWDPATNESLVFQSYAAIQIHFFPKTTQVTRW